MITVFTPVYNRRYILEKCYQSLLHQTNKNFKWLIVDDGSTDQVEDLITQWIEEKKIAIHFIRQENGGKHVAHNTGVLNCDTDLFICVDSDDYLTDDAIELVYKYWDMIKNNQQLAGIAMLRKYQNGQLMSTHMPKGIDSSTLYDLYENYHFKGDLALVFRTEILKKYLFPQFENEKFPLNLLQSAAMEIINTFKINGFLKQYILCACIPVGKRIEVAVVNQTLDKIFVPFKRARDIATIDFKDGESLADDVFKEVIEAVCSAGGVTDKLEIFKTHIHSLKDMVDFLESECLYGREYQALYRSLSELELALLLKILTVEDEMHFKVCLQEIKQKEVLMHIWESELICFLGDKEEEFRCRLWPVIQNIKIQK